MRIKKIRLQFHGEYSGNLVAVEECKDIPFSIKRVYYMYDTKNDAVRGRHAHKSLEQVIICVHGSCKIKLDDGQESEILTLDKPNEGIYISCPLWREVYDFSPDAVLMVLASELYQESDYIRDYKDFLDYVKNQKGGNDEAT